MTLITACTFIYSPPDDESLPVSTRDNNMTLVTACTFIYSPPDDEPLSMVQNALWLLMKQWSVVS